MLVVNTMYWTMLRDNKLIDVNGWIYITYVCMIVYAYIHISTDISNAYSPSAELVVLSSHIVACIGNEHVVKQVDIFKTYSHVDF